MECNQNKQKETTTQSVKTFIKGTIVGLLILFVSGSICCMNKNVPEEDMETKNDVTFNVVKIARVAFFQIKRTMGVELCEAPSMPGDEELKCKKFPKGLTSLGSGTKIFRGVLDKKNVSYIMTANHVCVNTIELPPEVRITSSEIMVKDIEGKIFPATIVLVDEGNDLCLLKIENSSSPGIKVAKTSPKIGQRIVNIAAPKGFFMKDLVPIYEAIYIGDYHDVISVYTTHAYPGSSGSMLLNPKGEMVGILHSAVNGMSTVVFSPSHRILFNFISEGLKKESALFKP